MAIKVEVTSRRIYDGEHVIREMEFNDERHLENYLKKYITNGNMYYKYVNHKVIHKTNKAILTLNDAELIFELAKTNKYSNVRDLIRKELKINI